MLPATIITLYDDLVTMLSHFRVDGGLVSLEGGVCIQLTRTEEFCLFSIEVEGP